jgi:hypothetical protein
MTDDEKSAALAAAVEAKLLSRVAAWMGQQCVFKRSGMPCPASPCMADELADKIRTREFEKEIN